MSLLVCPRSGEPITHQANGWLNKSSQTLYPNVGGVAWLWPDPGNALLDWRNRCNRLLASVNAEHTQLHTNIALASVANEHETIYAAGLTSYQAQLENLLAPLKVGEPTAIEVHNALRTPYAAHHAADSYMQNVFRDWAWGDQENQDVLNFLLEVLQREKIAPKNIAVLGSGAGRLAYDLHQALAPTTTFALDANPLLCLVAQNMFTGKALTLIEFPRAPIDAADYAVEQQLSAPAESAPGLTVLCADIAHLPLKAGALDLVVTPWLIDVLDYPLSHQCQLYGDLLAAEGHWLNFGSLGFNAKDPAERFTTRALHTKVEATGFAVVQHEDREFAYLQSPHNRQRRFEMTHTFLARRTSEKTQAPRTKQPADWISDHNRAVPLNDSFRTQLTTTRIHAFIMGLVDGQRSIRDMAKVLEDQRLMPAKEAEAAVTHFLQVMLETSEQEQKLQ